VPIVVGSVTIPMWPSVVVFFLFLILVFKLFRECRH
jgi:hypothetical protein